MKKSMIAVLAFAAMSSIAFAAEPAVGPVSVGVEYDFHKTHNDGTTNHYGAVGVIKPTAYGTVDLWLQGNRTYAPGLKADNSTGWEVGYSQTIPFEKFTLVPRVAYGRFNNIEGVGSSKYMLATIEGQMPINEQVGGFAAYSHTMGLGDAPSANRVTAGVDVALDKNVALRLGVSHIRQSQADSNGVYSVLTYSFN